MSMSNEEVKTRVVEKLLRNVSVGANITSIDEVTAWFPSHQKGVVQEALEELLQDSESPVEDAPSTAVSGVRLSSVEEASEYLQSSKGEVPWGFQDKDFEDRDSPDITSSGSSKNGFHSRISDLEEELERMNEAAKDWRSEARRRQRLSVLFGVFGFVIGVATSGLVGYLI